MHGARANNEEASAVDEAVDMRSNRLRFHKTRAKRFILKGESTLSQKMITNGYFLKFETAALLFYQASISFRACSKWRDAGDALVRCASLHHLRLKCYQEAAALYCEAAEVYEKVDKNDALKNYKQSVSIYCDLGVFMIAGRLQRRLAEIHFELRHWEEAGDSFRKAADFLSSNPDQSDYCLEKSARCLIECKEYHAASELYVIVAESCVQGNMKFFNATPLLFRALLCEMAVPCNGDEGTQEKYNNCKMLLTEFETIDVLWRCSKHARFIRNIISFREEFDQHGFADHVFYWHTACCLDCVEIGLLNVVSDEIQEELDRRMREKKEAEKEVTRRERRKKRLEKKRKAMAERGLDPDSINLADIEDESDEESHTVGGTFAGGSSVTGGKSSITKVTTKGGTASSTAIGSAAGSDGEEEEYEEDEDDSSSGGDSDIELP
eukprot:CAMPEP_0185040614 /NCGR_PEP_ID=MMETSP1103-20130426/38876_1 /TAXON_ID=36769 /ORGANISM="Paraphysomonas bandaiensis, Strain Caron Lab Isolate" /LENGTH=437 /DNA_ID=CAMNT_0027579989 /DNA_START=44 /DNA_END=1354 /DNA_ORIENTATION=+